MQFESAKEHSWRSKLSYPRTQYTTLLRSYDFAGASWEVTVPPVEQKILSSCQTLLCQ